MLIKNIKLFIFISIYASIQPVLADESQKPSAAGDLLIEAIEKNDAVKVDELLSRRIDPNSRGSKNIYISPLKIAARINNRHIVDILIRYGANVKEKGVICSSINSADIVELLIANDANINDADCGGKSPIHISISSEALDSAEVLLKHGADINDQNNMLKRTPLHEAVLYGKTKSVKWVLGHGADVNRPDSQGQTAILLSPTRKGNVEIIKMLLDSGAKLSPKDIPTLTQGACRVGDLEILDFLNSKGTKPDFDACYTALAYLHSPNQDVLKWLTGKAKIKNIEVGRKSLLNIAVEKNNLEITKLLIDSGADVNKKDNYNHTPLSCALEMIEDQRNKSDNYKELLTILLKHGADPNILYKLAYTDGCDRIETTRTVERNKRIAERSKKISDMIEIAELLISFGADVNYSDKVGTTPLHLAASKNNIPMIKMLVSHGADLKAINKQGETPLHSSIIFGGSDMSCKLNTIETLCSLESNRGGKLDWVRIKEVANRRYIQNKQAIITLIDELEKSPSATFPGSRGTLIAKIVEDMPKSLQEKLNSCDSKIALAAAEEILNNSATLKEPLELFSPAFVLFLHGKKDEAVFWFYAAQLRVRYQLVFEKGDRGQLLTIMMMTVGAQINNFAFQDVTNLNRILDRVLEWDKKSPNPFRDKTRTENIDKQIEQVYTGVANLKAKLVAEKDDLEKKAKLEAPQFQAMKDTQAEKCRKSAQQAN